jgi:hypothetical protein
MTRKQKPPKHFTGQQWAEWQDFCDDVDGKCGPAEPENINIAQVVNRTIQELGYDVGAEYADARAESAFHDEDREDWKDVARVIREWKAAAEKK